MLNRAVIGVCVGIIGLMGVVAAKRIFFRPAPLPPPVREEMTLTVIPGWNLRQVAEYLVSQGFASTTEQVYSLLGEPASSATKATFSLRDFTTSVFHVRSMPPTVSWEGYLAPETFRVFKDAPLHDVVDKFARLRREELRELFPDGDSPEGKTSIHEYLTMASIIEKETKFPEDRAKVADILWRRLAKGWALQVDSSVHYAVDRTGDVFTTDDERAVDSPWNTYKYPGLPPGPISNPSVASIKAAIAPGKNDYWYFLSDSEGHIHYARTLEEQAINRAKYLR